MADLLDAPDLLPVIQSTALCEELLPAPDPEAPSSEWDQWETVHLLVHGAAWRIVDELRDEPHLVRALVQAVAA